jgi:hypothetical protein
MSSNIYLAQAKDDFAPTDWTLRFKHGKHTILLLLPPLKPWTAIKGDLLDTLRERYPKGLSSPSVAPTPLAQSQIPKTLSPNPISQGNGMVKIPDNINEVALGVLVDPNETSKGWTEIDTVGGGLKECPKSSGLKDGAAVAFAFLEQEGDEVAFEVLWSSYEEMYDMEAAGAEGDDDDEEMEG